LFISILTIKNLYAVAFIPYIGLVWK